MELTLYDYIINILGVIVVPVSLMIIASKWSEHPAEYKKNGLQLSGYKTTISMKSEDTWEFSQKYYFGLVEQLSLFVLIGSIIYIVKKITSIHFAYEMLKIIIIQVIIFLLPAIPTEIKLRKLFDKLGHRK